MYLNRDTLEITTSMCEQLLSCSRFMFILHRVIQECLPKSSQIPPWVSQNVPTRWLQLRKQLVKYMSNMSAASADLCRATCAFHALKGCGQALRGRNDLHHLSFQTSQIHQFWSHSWHGRKWMKYCTASWNEKILGDFLLLFFFVWDLQTLVFVSLFLS